MIKNPNFISSTFDCNFLHFFKGAFQYLYPVSGIPIGVSPLVGKWVKKSGPGGGNKEVLAKRDVDKTSISEMRTVKFSLDPTSFSRMEKR